MTKEPQLFEKSFITWVIAVLKTNKIDHNQMIINLKETNQKLALYAEESAPQINACMTDYYSRTFRDDLVEFCLEQDDPKQAAKEFFKAINTTPGTSGIQVSVFRQLQNKCKR